VKELRVAPPAFWTEFSAMKLPAPSVGMSARNCTLALKSASDAESSTTAPMPVPGPGSSSATLVESTQGLPPSPDTLIRISIGTPVWVVPVVGFVQFEVPAQVAVVALIPVKASV
jgi:hypothetical protein